MEFPADASSGYTATAQHSNNEYARQQATVFEPEQSIATRQEEETFLEPETSSTTLPTYEAKDKTGNFDSISAIKDISEINGSIEHLKQTLASGLEQIVNIQRAPDNLFSVTNLDGEVDTASQTHILRETGGLHKRKPSKRAASLNDLATCYLEERQNVLQSVLSVVASAGSGENGSCEEKLSTQQQMRIWTDVATDLDGYYLELLSRFLRIGRVTTEEMKSGSLLNYRASESVIDDLHKNQQKEVFQSREDVHNDIMLGQLQDVPGGMQGEISINDFIENLLARTNQRRQYAIGYFNYDATSDSESEPFPSPPRELNDSEAFFNDISRRSNPNISSDNAVSDFQKTISDYRVYIDEQTAELDDRKETIGKLKGENLQLMEGLLNFDEYKRKNEEKRMADFTKIKSKYEIELKKKESEIDELKKTSSLKVMSDGNVIIGSKNYACKSNKSFLKLRNLEECFNNACRQLEQLGSLAATTVDDSKPSDKGDFNVTLTGKFKDACLCGNARSDLEVFNSWVIKNLLELCNRSGCASVSNLADVTGQKNCKEYVDELFKRLGRAVESNREIVSNYEKEADDFKRGFEGMKIQLSRKTSRLQSARNQNLVFKAKIEEKEQLIGFQARELKLRKIELDKLRSENDKLQDSIMTISRDATSEKEKAIVLEEELRQLSVIEQVRITENDCLLEYFTKNLHKGEGWYQDY